MASHLFSFKRFAARPHFRDVESIFIPLMDCVLANSNSHIPTEFVSRQKPYVQWVQIFSIVECDTEKVICCGVVLDGEVPIRILNSIKTSTFHVDLLATSTDEIVSWIVNWHSFNIIEYVA